MMYNKNISVVMASYNGEEFIEQQIKSILDQLDEDDELIISDDASTDRTFEIISGIEDPRVRINRNRKTLGLIKNFQVGLKMVEGAFIFLSDQDDVWNEKKVEVFMGYLQEYDVVQSDAVIVDANLQVIHPSIFALKNSRPGLLRNLLSNNYIGCNMAFRRKVLALSLPFPDKIPMHDIWIGFVTELFFTSKFIPERLLYYRRHRNSVTQTGFQSPFGLMQKLKFRFNLVRYIPALVYRYLKTSKNGQEHTSKRAVMVSSHKL